MRVAILGGTGCGGRATAAALRAVGHTVLTVARGQLSLAPDLCCDRHDPDALRAAWQRFAPEVLVDHVAYTPDEVALVLASLPPTTRRYVLISSAAVYGAAADGPFDERARCRPQGALAKSKLAAERVAHGSSDPNLEIVTLRLGGLYGPGHAPLTPRGRDAELLARLRRGEPIPVPDTADALQPWFSGDHGRLITALIADPAPLPVLNAAGDERVPWPQVIEAWARAAGAPPPCLLPSDRAALRDQAPVALRPFIDMILSPPHLDTGRARERYPTVWPLTPLDVGARRTLAA